MAKTSKQVIAHIRPDLKLPAQLIETRGRWFKRYLVEFSVIYTDFFLDGTNLQTTERIWVKKIDQRPNPHVPPRSDAPK